MTSPDPASERRERVKQLLADSYPRVAKSEREPLPPRILAELQGRATEKSSPERDSFVQRLLAFLRGPQALGLGAAAALVVVAVIALLPERSTPTTDTGGEVIRSGGTTPTAPPLIVLHGLSDAQLTALRASPLFRPEQLTVVPAGQDLASFTEANRRPQLIVVDGSANTITMPFYEAEPFAPLAFDAGTDLETVLLDLLGELAQKAPQPEPSTPE